jgi:hypothetical protein
MDLKVIAQHLVPALRQSLRAPGLFLIGLDGGRPLEDEQREPWIRIKYGPARSNDWVGVVPATARFVRARGVPQETLNLIVKVNPRQGLARNLIPWIAARNHIVLDRPFLQYRSAAELDRTADRELHVYQSAAKIHVLQDVLPRCFGWAHDPASGEHALFLECVTDIERLDATGATADWPPDAIDAALRAAARWQAAFWGADEKRLAWAGPRPTTAAMVADTSLWRGLLNDARARFPHIVTQDVWRRRYGLIETMGEWHKLKDALPATLAHNDFNQRNVGFRTGTLALPFRAHRHAPAMAMGPGMVTAFPDRDAARTAALRTGCCRRSRRCPTRPPLPPPVPGPVITPAQAAMHSLGRARISSRISWSSTGRSRNATPRLAISWSY